jgi:hypothetical protein
LFSQKSAGDDFPLKTACFTPLGPKHGRYLTESSLTQLGPEVSIRLSRVPLYLQLNCKHYVLSMCSARTIAVSQFAELPDQDPAQSVQHVLEAFARIMAVTAFGHLNLTFHRKRVKEGFQIARGSMLKAEG